MLKLIYRSTIATLLLALILCGFYPLLVTGLAKVFFSEKAGGGLIKLKDGRVIGAQLIGQSFTKPEYFHGRPSAAGNGYDASNSSGSNLGPTNQKLVDALQANIDTALKDNPSLKKGQIPNDLVTTSASGLDPHISPDAAFVQADRIAQTRKTKVDQIQTLVKDHVEGPQWGIFGEPVVNVLLLNIDLDRLYPMADKVKLTSRAQ